MNRINGVSLFSSAGIAELYFNKIGIDIKVSNEFIKKRCDLHQYLYPNCKAICGDITDKNIYSKVLKLTKKNKCKFLIATPPCQGMSSLGKKEYSTDKRNYLVFYALDLIEDCDFDFILIENVQKFLKLYFPFNGQLTKLIDICKKRFGDKYNIDSFVLNAKDYGVPQSRPRAFIRFWKKKKKWLMPKSQKIITLSDCIADLPSLMPGDISNIKWHNAKVHNKRDINAMLHTKTGESAMKNTVHYPRKVNGERIKGFHNTYKRMKWDQPAPARAMNSGNIGGHNNVHPGRKMKNGLYSDPRVLTLRELFIVSSIDPDWNLPDWCTDNFIREIVGEAIPPMFAMNILKGINK